MSKWSNLVTKALRQQVDIRSVSVSASLVKLPPPPSCFNWLTSHMLHMLQLPSQTILDDGLISLVQSLQTPSESRRPFHNTFPKQGAEWLLIAAAWKFSSLLNVFFLTLQKA